MKSVDFLIIGGSAAGTTAAESIRNLKSEASISIVNEEDHEFYSRVLIPHYIRGRINREQIFLRKSTWYSDNKIELVKKTKVKNLDPKNKIVSLSNDKQIRYGKLLIATGGKVIPLKIPGSESKNIYYMRTVEDADGIIEAVKKSKKAVIIGGGFIGLEFASSFRANGIKDVSLLVMEDYYWEENLDQKSGAVLERILDRNGIKIIKSEVADHFDENGGIVSAVITKSNTRLEADLVGVGIGIRADLSWLESSGVKTDQGIVTNEYLQTNVPDIFAAGDCAQFYDMIFKREHGLGNWANATSQGAAVGKTMTGDKTVFETASSYSINFFDQPFVGERQRVEAGGACSFIGITDAEYADKVISRGSVSEGKMTRIFVKKLDGVTRVVGATVINSTPDVAPLTNAVKSKIDVSSYKDQFADTGFDLNKIISG